MFGQNLAWPHGNEKPCSVADTVPASCDRAFVMKTSLDGG
jgi:hypothetical protein